LFLVHIEVTIHPFCFQPIATNESAQKDQVVILRFLATHFSLFDLMGLIEKHLNKKTQGGDSQNFSGKFVRFFLTLRCF